MGYGDFKLFAAIGAWLGWQMLPLVLLLAAAVGAVVGIAMMAASRLGRGVPIPFGPYLAGAAWIALAVGSGHRRGLSRVRRPRADRDAAHRPHRRHRERQDDGRGSLRRARRDRARHRRDRARGRRTRPARTRGARQGAAAAASSTARAGSTARSCAAACSRTRRPGATSRPILHPAILAELERQARAARGPYQVFVIPLAGREPPGLHRRPRPRRGLLRGGTAAPPHGARRRGAGNRPCGCWPPRPRASSASPSRTTSSTTAARPPTCPPRWRPSTSNTADWPRFPEILATAWRPSHARGLRTWKPCRKIGPC